MYFISRGMASIRLQMRVPCLHWLCVVGRGGGGKNNIIVLPVEVYYHYTILKLYLKVKCPGLKLRS